MANYIEQCKALPPTSELEELLYCAVAPSHDKPSNANVNTGIFLYVAYSL